MRQHISLPWLAFSFSIAISAQESDDIFTTQDLRLIRWSSGPDNTAYIPSNALQYLRSHHDQINVTSPILDDVPKAFVKHMLHQQRGPGFLDLTEVDSLELADLEEPEAFQAPSFPTPLPALHPEVVPMLRDVSSQDLYNIVKFLSTNFSTRYYRSANAAAPSLWIRDQFLAATSNSSNVQLFNNTFDQPNGMDRLSSANANELIYRSYCEDSQESGIHERRDYYFRSASGFGFESRRNTCARS
jgi:hypothetical protein